MKTNLRNSIKSELQCKGLFSQKIKFDSFNAPIEYFEIIKDILLNDPSLNRHQIRNCLSHLGILTTQHLIEKNEEFFNICLKFIDHKERMVRERALSYVIGKYLISLKFNGIVKIGDVDIENLKEIIGKVSKEGFSQEFNKKIGDFLNSLGK